MLMRSLFCREYNMPDFSRHEEVKRRCQRLLRHLERAATFHFEQRPDDARNTRWLYRRLLNHEQQGRKLLQELNMELWCREIPMQDRSRERFNCPLPRLLAFLCRDNKGTFNKASVVTQVTAKLQFICQTTVLTEVKRMMDDGDA